MMYALSYLHFSMSYGLRFTLNTGNAGVPSMLTDGVLWINRMSCLWNRGHFSMLVYVIISHYADL